MLGVGGGGRVLCGGAGPTAKLPHLSSPIRTPEQPPTLTPTPTPHPTPPNRPHHQAWRARQGRAFDFSQLDRANGAGWDLAQKLLAKRNSLNRGRMSVEQALRHRYLNPGLFQ